MHFAKGFSLKRRGKSLQSFLIGKQLSAPNLMAQGTLHINNLIKRLDSTQFLTSNYHASHHNIR